MTLIIEGELKGISNCTIHTVKLCHNNKWVSIILNADLMERLIEWGDDDDDDNSDEYSYDIWLMKLFIV